MPQLIITDWVMPEMDGIEFCKALRQNPAWRNIYVFIVTAQESTERLVEAFEAGANDYLTKPINFKVLGARLWAAQRVVQLQEELEFDRQQLRKFAAELAASNQRLQKLALTDVLPELPNRRYANEQLDRQWALAERNGRPLACMMVDIDRFKQINDTYGHKVGDDVLKQVANVLRQTARKQDMVCRLGGEEFLVICPEAHAGSGLSVCGEVAPERRREQYPQRCGPGFSSHGQHRAGEQNHGVVECRNVAATGRQTFVCSEKGWPKHDGFELVDRSTKTITNNPFGLSLSKACIGGQKAVRQAHRER